MSDMISRADAQKLLAKSDLLSVVVSLRLQAAFDALPAVEVGVKPECGHPFCGDKCGTATPAQDGAGIAARIKRIQDELLTRASAEPDDVTYAYRDAATALDVMFEYEPLARMKEAGE